MHLAVIGGAAADPGLLAGLSLCVCVWGGDVLAGEREVELEREMKVIGKCRFEVN